MNFDMGKRLREWRREQLLRRAAEELSEQHVPVEVIEIVLDKIVEEES